MQHCFYLHCNIEVTLGLPLKNFNNVEIKNLEQSKTLVAGTNWVISDIRTVVTGRKNETDVDKKGLWILEKISGNFFRIKTKVGGEYLYTDEEGLVDTEGQRRGVAEGRNCEKATEAPRQGAELWSSW